MATKTTPSRTAHRSAVTGEFITKQKAERNPRESVKERIPLPKPTKR